MCNDLNKFIIVRKQVRLNACYLKSLVRRSPFKNELEEYLNYRQFELIITKSNQSSLKIIFIKSSARTLRSLCCRSPRLFCRNTKQA